jgi:hypothetical protein
MHVHVAAVDLEALAELDVGVRDQLLQVRVALMQGHSGGWLTSVPGDVEFRMQALPDSPPPGLLRSTGYVVTEVARTQRILPHAIRQQFAAGEDGEMEPLTIGSTRPVAMTVTHAGIAAVIEYDLIPADAVPDQRMRIAP